MLAGPTMPDTTGLGLDYGAANGPRRGEPLEVGKVFVGGLSRETTTDGLRLYFERFGDISDCVVMKDRSTGAPRGFGFVTYASQVVADRVVHHRHIIDGKEVEAKPAVPRDSESLASQPRPAAAQMPPMPSMHGFPAAPTPHSGPAPSANAGSEPHFTSNKIFVGGLSHETSETDFVSYFGIYGQVVDCVIMCDPHTRKPRGFGFITYDSSTAVDRACTHKFHELNGKRVEVKRAIPQERIAAEEGSRAPRTGIGASPSSEMPGGASATQRGFRATPHTPSFGCDNSALDAALSTAASVLSTQAEPVTHNTEAQVPSGLLNAFSNPSNFGTATAALSSGLRAGYGKAEEVGAAASEGSAPQSANGTSSMPPQQSMQIQQVQQQETLLKFQQQLLQQQSQSQQTLLKMQHEHEQQQLIQAQQQQLQQLQQQQQLEQLQQMHSALQQRMPSGGTGQSPAAAAQHAGTEHSLEKQMGMLNVDSGGGASLPAASSAPAASSGSSVGRLPGFELPAQGVLPYPR